MKARSTLRVYQSTKKVGKVDMSNSTLSIVRSLKEENQDYEWYPTSEAQIKIITDDIKKINEDFDFTSRYAESVKVLDIGAGDGRVLKSIESTFEENEDITIECFAIEKASIHTSTYRKQNITLLGTEFDEVNFISKKCEIAFVNPPFSAYSHWLRTLITHLNFGLLYAVIPKRWVDDPAIKEALKLRGVNYTSILSESNFHDADRTARAKVHLVRFSFDDLNPKNIRFKSKRYKPMVGRNSTDPFQLFIENELGLKKTYSETTKKFTENCEKNRVQTEISTKGSQSFELIKSKGVLEVLIDCYERDLHNLLEQYKMISEIDARLLQELGVEYDSLCKSVREKSLGYRNVYWSLLFDRLDAISKRLTTEHKNNLLNKLSANALDFTYKNAIYVIKYAVDIGNTLIEQSLIDVFKKLTSSESISRYYKSNEHVYRDDWRYTDSFKSKYLLDYRFILSRWSNFTSSSSNARLGKGAINFTNDLMVAFKLLGYNNVNTDIDYEDISFGQKLCILGTNPDGKMMELVHIRYYKNGNLHFRFNQSAMLRLNVTVSRLLGWVRKKEEFETESGLNQPIDEQSWNVSNGMKLSPTKVLLLTNRAA